MHVHMHMCADIKPDSDKMKNGPHSRHLRAYTSSLSCMMHGMWGCKVGHDTQLTMTAMWTTNHDAGLVVQDAQVYSQAGTQLGFL